MILKGRRISGGTAEGPILRVDHPVSFLGGVDPKTGQLQDRAHGDTGESVAGRIFAFPQGKGSTVGSYAMYGLRLSGVAPAGIVNAHAEPIIATGAIIAEIPMIDGIDIGLLETDDQGILRASAGELELPGVGHREVVTSILSCEGRYLILKRSGEVGTYQHHWAGVSGYVNPGESPQEASLREVAEETGSSKAQLLASARPIRRRHGSTVWEIHPFLYQVPERTVQTDWEHEEVRWILREELSGFQTVPWLDEVFDALIAAVPRPR